MDSNRSRARAVEIVQAAALALVLTYYAGLASAMASKASSGDFVKLFRSSQALVAGESLYRSEGVEALGAPQAMGLGSEGGAHPNLNPPLLALLLAPMTMTGLAESYVCLFGLSLVLGLAGCGLIWNELRAECVDNRHLPWLWIAFLVYFPTYTALKMGQVTFLLLLPVVGAWVAARRGRDTLAGILIGIAFSLKLFVGLILLYFVLQRRGRIVAWSAGTVMLVAAMTLPIVGLRAYVEYVGVVRSVTWFGSSWNASYAAFFTRLLGGSENVPWVDAPGVGRAVVGLLSTLAIVWLAWLSTPARGGRRENGIFDLGYGLTLTSMLLISPLGWMYYFPLLVLPAYLIWTLTRSRANMLLRLGLILAWALSSIPTPLRQANEVNDAVGWFTSDSLYHYALLVLLGVLSRALWVRRRSRGLMTDRGTVLVRAQG